MQFAYRVYSLICSSHPAFCVLILSLGLQPSTMTLVTRFSTVCPPPGNQINNITFLPNAIVAAAEPESLALSSFYFLASVSSSAFAMVYLYAMDESDNNIDESNNFSRGSDLLFWCFLYASTCVSIALTTKQVSPIDQLHLRCVLHFGALFLLCSPNERGAQYHQLSLTIALLLVMGSSIFATTVACSQIALALCYMHRFLDLILILAHRWETALSKEVLYNSRLFFIAFVGILLHLDVILLEK